MLLRQQQPTAAAAAASAPTSTQQEATLGPLDVILASLLSPLRLPAVAASAGVAALALGISLGITMPRVLDERRLSPFALAPVGDSAGGCDNRPAEGAAASRTSKPVTTVVVVVVMGRFLTVMGCRSFGRSLSLSEEPWIILATDCEAIFPAREHILYDNTFLAIGIRASLTAHAPKRSKKHVT
jgi:hypothetical protein